MKYLAIAAVLIAFLSSCEETIDLDLRQTPPRVVVEGQVVDQAGHSYVKLSRTNDFYTTGGAPRITDATVSVEDSDGNTFEFFHNPRAHKDSVGYYMPTNGFAGVIGKKYSLTVVAGEETFTAEDTMLPITPMERLEYQINQDQVDDPEDEGKVYEVLMFVKEPPDQKNYYLFKFYRNDSLTYFNDTDIYFSDDKLLAENIDGIPSPIYFGLNDVARVEAYSISRTAYVFYNDLSNLINGDGGIFGPPPANPRTNISNGGLGFFQVSALNASSITIEP